MAGASGGGQIPPSASAPALSQAVALLQHERLAHVPLAEKVAFLRSQGFSASQIEAAVARATTTSVVPSAGRFASAAAASSPALAMTAALGFALGVAWRHVEDIGPDVALAQAQSFISRGQALVRRWLGEEEAVADAGQTHTATLPRLPAPSTGPLTDWGPGSTAAAAAASQTAAVPVTPPAPASASLHQAHEEASATPGTTVSAAPAVETMPPGTPQMLAGMVADLASIKGQLGALQGAFTGLISPLASSLSTPLLSAQESGSASRHGSASTATGGSAGGSAQTWATAKQGGAMTPAPSSALRRGPPRRRLASAGTPPRPPPGTTPRRVTWSSAIPQQPSPGKVRGGGASGVAPPAAVGAITGTSGREEDNDGAVDSEEGGQLGQLVAAWTPPAAAATPPTEATASLPEPLAEALERFRAALRTHAGTDQGSVGAAGLRFLLLSLENLARHPASPRYKRVSTKGSAYKRSLGQLPGTPHLMQAAGFQNSSDGAAWEWGGVQAQAGGSASPGPEVTPEQVLFLQKCAGAVQSMLRQGTAPTTPARTPPPTFVTPHPGTVSPLARSPHLPSSAEQAGQGKRLSFGQVISLTTKGEQLPGIAHVPSGVSPRAAQVLPRGQAQTADLADVGSAGDVPPEGSLAALVARQQQGTQV